MSTSSKTSNSNNTHPTSFSELILQSGSIQFEGASLSFCGNNNNNFTRIPTVTHNTTGTLLSLHQQGGDHHQSDEKNANTNNNTINGQKQPQHSISNRYVYEKFIAKGGFGAVYLAHYANDETKKVAIKIAAESSANRELRKECFLLAQLPPDLNVVNVIDVEREVPQTISVLYREESSPISSTRSVINTKTAASVATTTTTTTTTGSSSASSSSSSKNKPRSSSDGRIGLVMEYCEKGSLLDLIHEREKRNSLSSSSASSLFSEKESALMILQILSGLQFLHNANIIHRDIKCGNILLSESIHHQRQQQQAENNNNDDTDNKENKNSNSGGSNFPLLKIADFGLIYHSSSSSPSSVGLIGTVSFLSPETLMEGRSSTKSDIWAAGGILSQLLNGKAPWHDVRAKSSSQAQQFFAMRNLFASSSSTPQEVIEEYLIPKTNTTTISEEAKTFLRKLLHPDPEKRPAAKQIIDECFEIFDQEETEGENNTTTKNSCWIMSAGGAEVRAFLNLSRKFNQSRFDNCVKLVKQTQSPLARVVLARLLPPDTWISVGNKNECRSGLFADAVELEPENDIWHYLRAIDAESTLDATANSDGRRFIQHRIIQRCYEKLVEICPYDSNYWLRLGMNIVTWKAKIRVPKSISVTVRSRQRSLMYEKAKKAADDDENNDKNENHHAKFQEQKSNIDNNNANDDYDENELVTEEWTSRQCLCRALEIDPNLALAWQTVGRELKRWNMTKTVDVRGQKYNYYECLQKAADIIEYSSIHQGTTPMNATIITEQQQTTSSSPPSSSPDDSSSNKAEHQVLVQVPPRPTTTATSSLSHHLCPRSMFSSSSSSSSGSQSSGACNNTKNNDDDDQKQQQQQRQMNLELVTAVVTKTQPKEFWTSLGRAIPLCSDQVKKSKSNSNNNVDGKDDANNTRPNISSSTSSLPSSRAECLKKALDCGENTEEDFLLWMEWAIAVKNEDSSFVVQEKQDLLRGALQKLLELTLVVTNSQTSTTKWKILGWIFSFQLAHYFLLEEDNVDGDNSMNNVGHQIDPEMSIQEHFTNAVKQIKIQSPKFDGTEAWLSKSLCHQETKNKNSGTHHHRFLELLGISSLEEALRTSKKTIKIISTKNSEKRALEAEYEIEVFNHPTAANILFHFFDEFVSEQNSITIIPRNHLLRQIESLELPLFGKNNKKDNNENGEEKQNDDHANSTTSSCSSNLFEISFLVDENICVDISGAQQTPGTPIQLYKRNHTKAQRFYLQKVVNNNNNNSSKNKNHDEDDDGDDASSSANSSVYNIISMINDEKMHLTCGEFFEQISIHHSARSSAVDNDDQQQKRQQFRILPHHFEYYYDLPSFVCQISSVDGRGVLSPGEFAICGERALEKGTRFRSNIPVTLVPSFCHVSTMVRIILNDTISRNGKTKNQ